MKPPPLRKIHIGDTEWRYRIHKSAVEIRSADNQYIEGGLN